MSSTHQDTSILTASNLQKHTITSHETPRTKIMRYLNHQFPEQGEEDFEVLKKGSSSSLELQNPSPWDPTLDFMPSNLPSKKFYQAQFSEYNFVKALLSEQSCQSDFGRAICNICDVRTTGSKPDIRTKGPKDEPTAATGVKRYFPSICF